MQVSTRDLQEMSVPQLAGFALLAEHTLDRLEELDPADTDIDRIVVRRNAALDLLVERGAIEGYKLVPAT